jgi:hypothetical protein
MARYGIVAAKVFGVSVANVRALAKEMGRDHALADEVWRSAEYQKTVPLLGKYTYGVR